MQPELPSELKAFQKKNKRSNFQVGYYSSEMGVFLVDPCDNLNSSSFIDFIRGCGDCPNVAPRWSRVLLADMFSIVSCGGAA